MTSYERIKAMSVRLIDAEAFQRFIEKQDESADYERCRFEEWLEQQPTIETKPIVHAHWKEVLTVVKKIHEYEQEDIQYRCDHCGHIVDDFENYCGGCGAQMFEGVKIPVISMEDLPKIMEEMEK